jgi:hypothetical protein
MWFGVLFRPEEESINQSINHPKAFPKIASSRQILT